MSKKQTQQISLIYYYIPQDHDSEQYPNVFAIMTSKSVIKLSHLHENFPLNGTYLFRFKVQYDNMIAWLDLPDLQSKLPLFKDKIIVKVTRISWDVRNPLSYLKYQGEKKMKVKNENVNIKKQSNEREKQKPLNLFDNNEQLL